MTAYSWWDQEGPMGVLHALTPLRIKFFEACIGARRHPKASCTHGQQCFQPSLHVLDVGCGGGIFSEALSDKGFSVLGTDIDQDALHQAALHQAALHQASTHKRQSHGSLDYVHTSGIEPYLLENFGLARSIFDVICFMECLEHVSSPYAFLRQWLPYLKEGGRVIGSTINRTKASYIQAILGGEYVLRWIPQGTHSWFSFIKPQELQSFFQSLLLENSLFQGYEWSGSLMSLQDFKPSGSRWRFCSNVDVLYFFCASKAPPKPAEYGSV